MQLRIAKPAHRRHGTPNPSAHTQAYGAHSVRAPSARMDLLGTKKKLAYRKFDLLFWWLPGPCGCTPLLIVGACQSGHRRGCQTDRPPNPEESDKARSMSGFKEPSFADRQKAAQQARQNILNKFRSQPGPDDPAVMQRQAEREARAAERAKAKLAREAAKAEQKRLEEEAAAEAAAKLAREKEEAAARELALEAERKAARDARYAARKKKRK